MTKILTDTTSGLSLANAEELGFYLVPQIVNFGEESYRDDTELDTVTFLQKLRAANELPKTAAPPPALYDPVFSAINESGEDLICLHPSAKVSGTIRSATVAKANYPDANIHIVDTEIIAGPLATLVLLAAQWAKDGIPAEIIVDGIEDLMAQQKVYFLVDTLEYLQKGGRIGGARALLGKMLNIKPILTMEDGQIEAFEQARTKKKAIARLAALVAEQAEREGDPHICVMHSDSPEDAQTLIEAIRSEMGIKNIPLYELPPAIVVHAGPGALAVGFIAR
jgi:DegV family protein with EDD domain